MAPRWRPALRTDYTQVKACAIERFEPPTVARSNSMQNVMGATFARESLHWSWPSGTTADLHEGLMRTDTSTLVVETPTWAKAQAAQQREKVERAKKAF